MRKGLCQARPGGRLLLTQVIMVREVTGKKGKHSMVQSTAGYRWSDSCSEHCVVHRRRL